MNHLIGLVGKKQTGKDTIYNIIFELWNHRKLNLRPTRLSFADELKNDIATAFGTTVMFINDNKSDAIMRKLLQCYGVCRREENPNYWVDKVSQKMASYDRIESKSSSRLFVVTDVRFLNEANWILQQGGKLIKVQRPVQGELDFHVSETELDKIPCDHVINNDGNEKQLELPVGYVMEQMKFL